MYVFLPAKTSHLEEFVQTATAAALMDWIGRFQRLEGGIQLPRFTLTHTAELKGALSKLGMEIAFDPQRAQFDAIHLPPPPGIGRIVHRAVVDVNEEGTEAASMTAATFLSSEEPEKTERTFEMIVDRPFFFLIYDRITSTILFMGAVEDPG
jgi:serine protease inhibitor